MSFAGVDDPSILAWAAEQGRIRLTHDKRTITKYAYERVRTGQPMPGVFAILRPSSIGVVIEDILLLVEASRSDEWENQVVFVPI